MKDLSDKLAAAQAHLAAGRTAQARALLQPALQRASGPPAAAACRLLAQVALAEKNPAQALYQAQRGVSFVPDEPDSHLFIANVHAAIGDTPAAIEAARAAVSRFPSSRNAHATLLNLYLREDRFADVRAGCEAALRVFPEDPEFSTSYGSMLLSLGQPERAVELLRGAMKKQPKNFRAYTALLPALNYLPGADPAESVAVARAYGTLLAEMLPPRAPGKGSGPLDPDRPLKLGFVSPDLRNHPMRFFIEPVFEHLDKSQFNITCYFTGGQEDDASARLKRHVPNWKHLPTLHVGHLADVIVRDGIDLLVDLAGHTRYERLGTMHLRPAPVQFNYIGYPATTGVRAMDYYITDSCTSPPGQESHWTERLLRVDPVFFAYKPVSDPPAITPPPHVASGVVTFGSFNTLLKLNDAVVQVWTKVVRSVPGSRLLIKNTQMGEEEARRLTRERFVAAGLPDDRLEIIGHTGTFHDHLATYARVDVSLDTFPYSGMTTTLESLLMGVPVVSIAQDRHASRVSLDILRHVGLEDMVASSESEFVLKATALASDAPRLARLRSTLRAELLASILCDGPALGVRLGRALRQAWADHCRNVR